MVEHIKHIAERNYGKIFDLVVIYIKINTNITIQAIIIFCFNKFEIDYFSWTICEDLSSFAVKKKTILNTRIFWFQWITITVDGDYFNNFGIL